MIRPRLSSTIERRLLVNYRVDPSVAAALLPAPLRPQLVRGQAVAGICLLRIGGVRPGWAPAATGLTSENAAHRISVEWDGPDGVECGVYIPRRDTASRLNAFAGGRIYPGEHGRADSRCGRRPTPYGWPSRPGTVRWRSTRRWSRPGSCAGAGCSRTWRRRRSSSASAAGASPPTPGAPTWMSSNCPRKPGR
ncbi:DUF2071 domain-containing protein [Streptomyces cyaneofuscatus]|uniref:DUF2071 domain-containing protein n=1 Tax=Streptomyces cyaneofuscatus TaxID=66883 RepID=UPI0036AFA56B